MNPRLDFEYEEHLKDQIPAKERSYYAGPRAASGEMRLRVDQATKVEDCVLILNRLYGPEPALKKEKLNLPKSLAEAIDKKPTTLRRRLIVHHIGVEHIAAVCILFATSERGKCENIYTYARDFGIDAEVLLEAYERMWSVRYDFEKELQKAKKAVEDLEMPESVREQDQWAVSTRKSK